jgi:hypothetical protein
VRLGCISDEAVRANGVPLGCDPSVWDAATEEAGGGVGGTAFGVAIDEGGGVFLAACQASAALNSMKKCRETSEVLAPLSLPGVLHRLSRVHQLY